VVRQNDLAPAPGAKHNRKRVGRGLGSGHGRYSTKGSKGQKARSGPGIHPYFEGGQLPLVRRLAGKRGFSNKIFRNEYEVINVNQLDSFPVGSVVGREEFVKARLLKASAKRIKILGTGELGRALTVKADKFSQTAKQKIEAAGGKVEEVGAAKAA
jgi:large subunit ribosomal protein L15